MNKAKRKAITDKQKKLDTKKRSDKRKAFDNSLDKEIKLVGTRNKEIRDADLRLRLEGKRTIDRLNIIADEFTTLDQQIKMARNTVKNPNRLSTRVKKNLARGQILKAQSDILFKKLNKLLPDIKSIEHSGIFKPSKPENMPEESLFDILKGNVDIEEIIATYPQYKDLMEELEDMDMPELAN